MGQPGIGAMLHALGGGSENDPAKFYGKKIVAAEIKDERLRLALEGGPTIEIWDNGQSCCESRYITTDDQVSSLVGGALARIETRYGPSIGAEYGDEHEQVFVEVGTDKGFITVVNHNEHNGYYGGFGLTVTETEN